MKSRKRLLFGILVTFGVLVFIHGLFEPRYISVEGELFRVSFELLANILILSTAVSLYLRSNISELLTIIMFTFFFGLWSLLRFIEVSISGDLNSGLLEPYTGFSLYLMLLGWTWLISKFGKPNFNKVFLPASILIFTVLMLNAMYRLFSGKWMILPEIWGIYIILDSVAWVYVLVSIELIYPSKRTRLGKHIWIFGATLVTISGIAELVFGFIPDSSQYWRSLINTITVVPWYLIFLFVILFIPEGFILTKHQFIEALRLYDGVRQNKKTCPLFCNEELNTYFKTMPEEFIKKLGDNRLTTLWTQMQSME